MPLVASRPPWWVSWALVLGLLSSGPAFAAQGHAPLLYIRCAGPEGTHLTFYQGNALGQQYKAPVVVGLRPGYLYRVRLSGMPGYPGVTLAPTLEVRGTLHLPPHVRSSAYPAPVVFSEHDLERVARGAMVTKVVYLEDPEKAVATPADQPLELTLPPNRDLLQEARDHGRPMLVIRLGQRDVRSEELAKQSVPGTILLPDAKALPAPATGPCLPWAGVPLYDPFLGPKPATEECLHDGGDTAAPAGRDASGHLYGLDVTDTLAEYTDCHGKHRVAHSNRICLCVPRFAVLRSDTPLVGVDNFLATAGTRRVEGQELMRVRLPSREKEQLEAVGAMQGRLKPSGAIGTLGPGRLIRLDVLEARHIVLGPEVVIDTEAALRLTEVQRTRLKKQIELALQLSQRLVLAGTEQVVGTAVVGRVQGLGVIRAEVETRDLTVCCHEKPHPPEKPLGLFKWADRQAAQVGDVVTFYLKYSNHGGQPIADVAVSDSLSGRLEYIPGSAQSDRNAVFTMQENEAGSVVLRWEVNGPLLPGQSGVVRFQARVR